MATATRKTTQAQPEEKEKPTRELKLPSGIRVELVKYTPEAARRALAKNEVNRSLREGSVAKYEADMKNGFWNLSESAIAYDEKGRLINGQHRLTAQVRANVTITWMVMSGLPEEYQGTMDNGAMRSTADVLHMMGMSDTGLLASIANIVVKLERGNFATSKNQVTVSEAVDCIHRNELLVHSTEEARRTVNGQTPIFPRVLGAAHWWISQYNEVEEADAFIARIAALTGEPKGSPVLALARRANEIKRQQIRVHWRDQFFMVMKAWNYDVTGEKRNRIETHAKSGGYQILIPEVREIPTVDRDEFTDAEDGAADEYGPLDPDLDEEAKSA